MISRRNGLVGLMGAVLAERVAPAQASEAAAVLAPGGTLRAVYIVANLAQATRDPATGQPAGVVVDLAEELARRAGMAVQITPIETAARVLDAVRQGEADIGFVAPNPDRQGVVLYSQTYMLVQQSAVVRDGSAIVSVRDLDAPGRTIGANTDDSVSVWLRGHLHQAAVRESADYSLGEAARWLADGTVGAFAGNRQRLGAGLRGVVGLRLLPDNLYGVPQTVAVPLGQTQRLALVNATLDMLRANGFLAAAMARSGVDGIAVAPPTPPAVR